MISKKNTSAHKIRKKTPFKNGNPTISIICVKFVTLVFGHKSFLLILSCTICCIHGGGKIGMKLILKNCSPLSSGSFTLNEKAPDTITSWYLTGFATNNEYGLGVTEDKMVFKVFKKFFISLNLPYSIKRGEAVLIQIVVFNYLPRDVTTTVTLDNSLKQFEFVDPNTQAYKDKGCPLSEIKLSEMCDTSLITTTT